MKIGVTYKGAVNAEIGMAMGGLGTSTLEIGRDGSFQNIRLQNAWSGELKPTPPATFLAVCVRRAGQSSGGRVLQLRPPSGLDGIQKLTYTGKFPFTRIDYHDPALPCGLSLEAFSPFVPRDAQSSSVPAVFFKFRIRNQTRSVLDVSAALSWANDISAECFKGGWVTEGNYNTLVEYRGLPAVRMNTRQKTMAGSEYLLVCLPAEGVNYTAVSDWLPHPVGRWMGPNVMVEGKLQKGNNEYGLHAWRAFLSKGKLPSEGGYNDGLGKYSWHQPAGAVAGQVRLNPGASTEIRFALAWCFPHHYDRPLTQGRPFHGHHYTTRFSGGTSDVAKRILPQLDDLRLRSEKLEELIAQSSLPPNLRTLMNEVVYLLPRISWWLADNRFCLYESIDCPRMHPTILERYMAPVLAALFPELHAQALRLIASHEIGTGEIPSTLGIYGICHPEYRVFSPGDVSIFPLSVAWQALWDGDQAFITEMYPVVKRVLQWGKRELDADGDNIPDVHGVDQGWDTFPMFGGAAYIADQWMAGLLAGERLAQMKGDAEFASWCRNLFNKASRFVEGKLWNGDYYNLSHDVKTGRSSDICFIDQFTYGTVAANMLGLGEVHPDARVKKALSAIWRLNVKPCAFVARAGSNRDGSPADCTDHHREDGASQSNAFSPATCAPLAAAAIQYGMVKEGLALAEAMADLIIHRLKTPWSGQLLFNSNNGQWFYGLHYSDVMILWDILHAMSGMRVNALAGELELAPPQIPVKMPVFSKFFCGLAEFEVERKCVRLILRDALSPALIPKLIVTLPEGCNGRQVRVKSGNCSRVEASGRCLFARDVSVHVDGNLEIIWA